MSDLVQTIKDFATLFDRLQIPYVIMGGWAVRLYGLPRPTYDIDIDIFLAESEYQQSLMQRRRVHEFAGMSVSFVSAEDLILLKLTAALPRDLGDIEDVMLARPDLDEAYMRKWAEPLGVAQQLEETLAARP